MATYNDIFSANGLFETIFKQSFGDLYTAVFGTQDAHQLDTWCSLKYGGRNVIDALTSDTANTLVSSVIALNAGRWQKVLKVVNTEYDILNPVTKKTESTKTVETSTSENNENINAQKVFNDDTFNDGNREHSTAAGTRADKQNSTDIESGIGNNNLISTVIQKEKALKDNEYRFTVISDIINSITLTIY